MPTYLLRVEAINLNQFITDNDDLSTIRGAGLLLLNLHRFLIGFSDSGPRKPFRYIENGDPFFETDGEPGVEMEDPLRYCRAGTAFERVTTGASICVYRFESSDEHAQSVRKDLDLWLRKHRRLRHATFAVEVASLTTSYRATNERLIAGVRAQQMRQPTLSVPAINTDVRPIYCDIDSKRPAVINLNHQTADDKRSAYAKANDKNFGSESTECRRGYGRDTKVRIYGMTRDLPEKHQHFVPTWTFDELSRRESQQEDALSHLAGKMAVVYFDGNRFGKLQTQKVHDIPTQITFDSELRIFRRNLMTSLVNKMRADREWQIKPSPEAQAFFADARELGTSAETLEFQGRIETLLWGGDELIWVVPAWRGLEAVSHFYQQADGLSVFDEPLTYAGGIVFCSHKSPIREVVKLAKRLAESVKSCLTEHSQWVRGHLSPEQQDNVAHLPESNAFAYEVLESFDDLGRDFTEARADRRGSISSCDQVIRAARLSDLEKHIRELKQHLPKRRLYELARCVRAKCGSQSPEFDTLVNRIAETNRDVDHIHSLLASHVCSSGAKLSDNDAMFRSAESKWYHIAELWDYVTPDSSLSEGNESS